MRNKQEKKENELKIALKSIENKNALDLQRLSISRDLHDNIGSQLTFIISSLDSTKQFFGKENLILDKRLSMINNFTRDTILELRDTIWAMNRSSITIEDLQSRISNFINNANFAEQKIEFQFDNQFFNIENLHFEAKKGMNIYRILQESINNAIKHSTATKIFVKLYKANQNLVFEIADNGKGFENIENSCGNGLQSMKKRAEEIGAIFEIISNANGTKIILSLNFMNPKINIAIVDDNLFLQKAVAEKLSFYENVFPKIFALNGDEIIALLQKEKHIDLILMDIEMPEMNGIEATKIIKKKYPQIKIIMLTVFDNDEHIFNAIQAGADGYLMKEVSPEKLYHGICETLKGGAAMNPSIAMKTLKLLRNPVDFSTDEKEISLSDREIEVLEQVSKGLSYTQIAENLFLSPSTIRKHIENIYKKLQVHSKLEAIQIARRNNLI